MTFLNCYKGIKKNSFSRRTSNESQANFALNIFLGRILSEMIDVSYNHEVALMRMRVHVCVCACGRRSVYTKGKKREHNNII